MRISSQVLLSRILARSRLRQWQLICEVANLGGVQKAADAVGMSQSAATHALAEIERLLGYPLFDRHAKGTRLTAIGAALVPKIKTAMAAFVECAEALCDMSTGRVGKLRVGAIEAASGDSLGAAIAAFGGTHPTIAVDVMQLRPEQLIHGLREAFIDVVIARRPLQLPAGIVYEDLWRDHYIIACSPRHPLAGRVGVTREQLAKHTWLAPPKSTVTARDFSALWQGTEPPRHLSGIEARAPFMWTMVEQLQALVISPHSLARPWIDKHLLAEVPGTWGPHLQPIGMLLREAESDERGPVRDFVDTLRGFRHPEVSSSL